MKFRHELKYEINALDCMIIRSRLRAVAAPDPHAADGVYKIRSLYFDNIADKALREKVDGVDEREKFRLRYYNSDTSYIRLEKKCKIHGLCSKATAQVTKEQVQKILASDYEWMKENESPLIREFYLKVKNVGLIPKTIVDYTREPFIYGPGNVRVTLDYDIRTGLACKDFLDTDCITIPARYSPRILEVKWDEFLPDIIKDAVQINRVAGAFSKYASCRMYE